jgi:prepilin-type processing-associated H-X9-DG protein
MFCQSCGAQVPDDAAKCQVCGAEIAKAAPAFPTNTQPQYQVPGYGEPPKTSPLAIASLVSSLLSIPTLFLGAIAGIILGALALPQIRSSGGRLKGDGLAVAGIVISGASFVLVLPILAAILFPVFAQAREKARMSACMSNEKELAMAMMMYAQDYNDCLPPASKWADVSGAYVRSKTIFKCPAAIEQNLGYAFNRALDAKPMGTIDEPSMIPELFDANAISWNAAGGPEIASLRHNRGLNVAFADGHVKWLQSTQGLAWSITDSGITKEQ